MAEEAAGMTPHHESDGVTFCEIDEAGNRWYPLSVATGWPIGTPVVCRRVSRESGTHIYSMFQRWQGAGCGEFEASAMFLRLAR